MLVKKIIFRFGNFIFRPATRNLLNISPQEKIKGHPCQLMLTGTAFIPCNSKGNSTLHPPEHQKFKRTDFTYFKQGRQSTK
jgi:hypothetical protein